MDTPILEIEGIWEEILEHDADLRGKHVRVRVVPEKVESPDDRLPYRPARGNSTGADLLKHAVGWAGDDFEACLEAVYRNRSKAKF